MSDLLVIIAPYLDVLIAFGIIGAAGLLMIWPAIVVSLIRFFPDSSRTGALMVAIVVCLGGTYAYYSAMPDNAGAGMQWRQAIVVETPDWEETVGEQYWVRAFDLDGITFRGPPADEFGAFLHGNIRAVAAMDRWFVRNRLVAPLLEDAIEEAAPAEPSQTPATSDPFDSQPLGDDGVLSDTPDGSDDGRATDSAPPSATSRAQTSDPARAGQFDGVGAATAVGRQLRTLVYGLVWTPMLAAYSRISPFIWGLLVAALWLTARRRGTTRSLEGTRGSELASAWPAAWMGLTIAVLALLAAPFKFEAPDISMDELVPELAGGDQATPPPAHDPVWDQAQAVDIANANAEEPDATNPGEPEYAAGVDPDMPGIAPLPVTDPAADEPWPETIEVNAVVGYTDIRSAPDLFGAEVVGRAFNRARLDVRGEQSCGADLGIWLPVRIAFDGDEEANPDHRGVEGFVQVQDVDPHRPACCGERLFDCIPWTEWNTEEFPEVPITAERAMVVMRSNIRSEPGSFPNVNNRNFRLRTDHVVQIQREVCTPSGHRWAYIRTEREMDDGSMRTGEGWAFRPSLTPNADGCCLGRTGADPSCMDGAEAFFAP